MQSASLSLLTISLGILNCLAQEFLTVSLHLHSLQVECFYLASLAVIQRGVVPDYLGFKITTSKDPN